MRLKHVFYLFILYCTHLFVWLVTRALLIFLMCIFIHHDIYIASIDHRDHKLYVQLAACQDTFVEIESA